MRSWDYIISLFHFCWQRYLNLTCVKTGGCCWKSAFQRFCKLLSCKVSSCSHLPRQRSIKSTYCMSAHIICEPSWLPYWLLTLSKKSWSYLQILQDTNTHTLGLKSVMSKQCLCLAVKPQILREIPGDGFCLYLLLSPQNVELLEEEEPRHTIQSGLFFGQCLCSQKRWRSLYLWWFCCFLKFSDHWCTEHFACFLLLAPSWALWLPPAQHTSSGVDSCTFHR